MSVILQSDTRELQINAWNWLPTVAIVARAGILLGDRLERIRHSGCGGTVSAAEAEAIAEVLTSLRRNIRPGGRVLLDGTITYDPKTHQLRHDLPEQNYSATVEWLQTFEEFCRRSGGFKVI